MNPTLSEPTLNVLIFSSLPIIAAEKADEKTLMTGKYLKNSIGLLLPQGERRKVYSHYCFHKIKDKVCIKRNNEQPLSQAVTSLAISAIVCASWLDTDHNHTLDYLKVWFSQRS